jgi:hypothetical protein
MKERRFCPSDWCDICGAVGAYEYFGRLLCQACIDFAEFQVDDEWHDDYFDDEYFYGIPEEG